jgi:curved DNA-binding protein CbpA
LLTLRIRTALENHPDKHPKESREKYNKLFQTVSEAWEVLLDPKTRREYDSRRTGQPTPAATEEQASGPTDRRNNARESPGMKPNSAPGSGKRQDPNERRFHGQTAGTPPGPASEKPHTASEQRYPRFQAGEGRGFKRTAAEDSFPNDRASRPHHQASSDPSSSDPFQRSEQESRTDSERGADEFWRIYKEGRRDEDARFGAQKERANTRAHWQGEEQTSGRFGHADADGFNPQDGTRTPTPSRHDSRSRDDPPRWLRNMRDILVVVRLIFLMCLIALFFYVLGVWIPRLLRSTLDLVLQSVAILAILALVFVAPAIVLNPRQSFRFAVDSASSAARKILRRPLASLASLWARIWPPLYDWASFALVFGFRLALSSVVFVLAQNTTNYTSPLDIQTRDFYVNNIEEPENLRKSFESQTVPLYKLDLWPYIFIIGWDRSCLNLLRAVSVALLICCGSQLLWRGLFHSR